MNSQQTTCGIYKITSPSDRIYIGQSINIEKRFSYYKSLANKSQPKLFRSFLKYGLINHKFEIILECKKCDLTKWERFYQEKYNCLISGLNCILVSFDNQPSQRSEETKIKISKTSKGKVQTKIHNINISKGRTGIKFTKEHCDNIRLSKTGKNNKRSRPILNTVTGEVYNCIYDAALKNNITDKSLSRYLLGTRTNKLPFLKYA